jgi:integrase
MAHGHLYLTSSRGVWYFQRWVNIKIVGALLPRAVNYRKSLRTKDIRIAKKKARKLAGIMDELIRRHFDSDAQFAEAMAVYHQVVIQNQSLDHYESMGWDDDTGLGFSREDMLLTKASEFSKQIDDAFSQLQNRIRNLEELLEKSLTLNEQFNLREEIANLNLDSIDDANNPTLQALFHEYKAWASTQKEMVALDTSYGPSIELFLMFLESMSANPDIRTADISSDLARQYVKFYAAIPKGTQIKNASVESLTGLSGELKTQKTIKDHVTAIHGFLSFASKHGYRIDQQMLGVLKHQSTLYGVKSRPTPRTAFSDDELGAIFNSNHYTTGSFKFSSMYWAPLIALFTGARLAEILQLTQRDITEQDGIWTININGDKSIDDPGKRVKTKAANRLLPIHPTLLDLDWINYVNAQSGRLFPDEERGNTGKFSMFSKRFKTFRQQVGLYPCPDGIQRDFHSFRHTVETRLKELVGIGDGDKRVDTYTVDSIIGHAPSANAIGEKVYNHSLNLIAKKNAIHQLQYPTVKFEEFMHWEKCLFIRNQFRPRRTRKSSDEKN